MSVTVLNGRRGSIYIWCTDTPLDPPSPALRHTPPDKSSGFRIILGWNRFFTSPPTPPPVSNVRGCHGQNRRCGFRAFSARLRSCGNTVEKGEFVSSGFDWNPILCHSRDYSAHQFQTVPAILETRWLIPFVKSTAGEKTQNSSHCINHKNSLTCLPFVSFLFAATACIYTASDCMER